MPKYLASASELLENAHSSAQMQARLRGVLGGAASWASLPGEYHFDDSPINRKWAGWRYRQPAELVCNANIYTGVPPPPPCRYTWARVTSAIIQVCVCIWAGESEIVVFSQFIARDSGRVHNSWRPRRFAAMASPHSNMYINSRRRRWTRPAHIVQSPRNWWGGGGQILFLRENANRLINCFRVQVKAAARIWKRRILDGAHTWICKGMSLAEKWTRGLLSPALFSAFGSRYGKLQRLLSGYHVH